MDLFDGVTFDSDIDREYSSDERPVNIGKWISYEIYNDEEQLEEQRKNILRLPVYNDYGQIGFILSKNIQRLEEFLEARSKEIKSEELKIENMETVLETEVYYSSKIEGADTTINRTAEIHSGAPVSEDNKYSESMIKGNFKAVKLLRLYGNTVDENILHKIWVVLTTDCRDNTSIQGKLYRNKDVFVSNSEFKCVPAWQLKDAVDKWLDFYNDDLLDDKPFIKAGILHYAFETIHPFCDGNGRLGRLLMNNYLISRGMEAGRVVSFSMEIYKKRGAYDTAFVDAENKYSDATPFVEYMLETMANAFVNA